MPVPPKKTISLEKLCDTLDEHAISSNGINRDELLRILKNLRAGQESLWQAQQNLREELLREIYRFAPNQRAPDQNVKRPAPLSAASFVNAPANMSLQPHTCGVPEIQLFPQPPTAVPQAGEPLPTFPQMLRETRSSPFEAVEVQSLEFETARLQIGENANSTQGIRSAEIEAPTALNARASKQSRIVSFPDDANGAEIEALTALNARVSKQSRSSSTPDDAHGAEMEASTAPNDRARKQSRRASLPDDANGYWEFRHSCWDVSFLLGHRQSFRALEASGNALLLSINIAVQGLLIIILFRLAGTTFDDATIEGYHKWRTITGHAIQYMDYLSEESLATRVCSGDASLHISNTQAVQVQNIDKYLRKHAPFNGPMMCILALLIWILTVSKEFHSLIIMLRACMGLPSGETVIAVQAHSIQLCSLSIHRLIYIILVVSLRAIIASCLLVAGVKFLIVTTSIQDILLNTVGLEFILEFDELLFDALAPRQTRMLVFRMNPLPVKGGSWKGLDADFFAIALTVIGAIAVAIPAELLPEMQRMRKAEEELCGGLIGFSYSVSSVNSVAWAAENQYNSIGQAWEQSKHLSRYTILRSIIENRYESKNITGPARLADLQGSTWSVDSLHKQDIVDLGMNLNRRCSNLIPVKVGPLGPHGALVSLRDSFHNQSISSCADVAMHCNNILAAVVRMMCPNTCGCDSPSSGLVFPFPNWGCPTPCLHKAAFVSALAAQPCADQPKHVLIQDASWRKLAENILRAAVFQNRNLWGLVSKLMLESGCGVTARAPSNVELCNGPRTIQFWCPMACNCSLSKLNPSLCPRSC